MCYRLLNQTNTSLFSPYVDPLTQSDYATFLYQIGMLDESEAEYLTTQQAERSRLITTGKLKDATAFFVNVLLGEPSPLRTWLQNVTEHMNIYNYMKTLFPKPWDYFSPYLTSDLVRAAIHVGSQQFLDGSKVVWDNLLEDISNTTKPELEYLIAANYKVLLYSGNLDIIVATPLTENLIYNLNVPMASQWPNVNKKVWKLSEDAEEVAGYVSKLENFWFVVIRNAGHIVSFDQPQTAFEMINKFVQGSL